MGQEAQNGVQVYFSGATKRFKTYVSYASITLRKVIGQERRGHCVLCQIALQPVIAQSSLCLFLTQLANRLAS